MNAVVPLENSARRLRKEDSLEELVDRQVKTRREPTSLSPSAVGPHRTGRSKAKASAPQESASSGAAEVHRKQRPQRSPAKEQWRRPPGGQAPSPPPGLRRDFDRGRSHSPPKPLAAAPVPKAREAEDEELQEEAAPEQLPLRWVMQMAANEPIGGPGTSENSPDRSRSESPRTVTCSAHEAGSKRASRGGQSPRSCSSSPRTVSPRAAAAAAAARAAKACRSGGEFLEAMESPVLPSGTPEASSSDLGGSRGSRVASVTEPEDEMPPHRGVRLWAACSTAPRAWPCEARAGAEEVHHSSRSWSARSRSGSPRGVITPLPVNAAYSVRSRAQQPLGSSTPAAAPGDSPTGRPRSLSPCSVQNRRPRERRLSGTSIRAACLEQPPGWK